jgi:predicted ABC-type ATPase
LVVNMKCYILAGPNGAGKTTFANEFLPIEAECLNFINADLIAQGLSPFQPEKMGYEIIIYFFKIPSVDFAIERVKLRVARGGHNIPESVIRRRFERSWENFNLLYKPLADSWIVFDTSGLTPVIIDEKGNDEI